MQLKRYVPVITAALMFTLGPLVDAGDEKGDARNKKSPYTDKSVEDSDGEWAADPERGWIRSGDSHRSQDQRQQAGRVKIPNGKQKVQTKQDTVVQDY